MKQLDWNGLVVRVGETTQEMAQQAAADFAADAARLLGASPEINVVFSGAESQGVFHAALVARRDIDWPRINAFAVDEFYAPGIPADCAVCAQPKRDLYAKVNLRSVNVIDFAPKDIGQERLRYEALIEKHPPHICCLGIGISGHIALNEPGTADFNDKQKVRFVQVCEASKKQLMQDPNFRQLGRIPDSGLTLTIPVLLSAPVVMVVAPYAIKADIIRAFRAAPVSPDFPATILKTKPGARLYLDSDSFPAY